jgi:hypothetical protein
MNTAEAAAVRDAAIAQVAENAERTSPGWQARAYSALERYCREVATEPFTTERARIALQSEIEAPHDLRAWGAVMKEAAACGLVRRVGYAPSRASHLSAMPLWLSVYTKPAEPDVYANHGEPEAPDFREALTALSLTTASAAALFRVTERSIRNWQSGAQPVPPLVSAFLRLMQQGRVSAEDMRLIP